MKHRITIDGTHFSTPDEFYTEMDKLLTRNLTWKTGHNLDAFHDLLRGGFGVHEENDKIEFYWLHSNKSRQELGYAVNNHDGETLFDIIVGEILDKSDGYDHTLILDDEY